MRSVPYRIAISAQVAAQIRRLHPDLKRRIRRALDLIAMNPRAGKALTEDLTGIRSWRVGRFRILYRLLPGQRIDITGVGPRDRIYDDAERPLERPSDT